MHRGGGLSSLWHEKTAGLLPAVFVWLGRSAVGDFEVMKPPTPLLLQNNDVLIEFIGKICYTSVAQQAPEFGIPARAAGSM